jgi:putative membrane protein
MRQFLLNSIIFAGTAFLAAYPAMAQPPAGGMQPQQAPQQSPPARMPPDMNGPGSPGYNPGTTAAPTKVNDSKFVKDAAEGGMAEVELGKLAAQKGSSPDVKQFGQKMVDDHTKANDQLKQIASSENINIPDSLSSKQQSELNKLSKLSGPKFDKAYIKGEVKDHKKDISEFQDEAQGGSKAAVKQFASQTLPTLQQHLSLAKQLGKTSKQASSM